MKTHRLWLKSKEICLMVKYRKKLVPQIASSKLKFWQVQSNSWLRKVVRQDIKLSKLAASSVFYQLMTIVMLASKLILKLYIYMKLCLDSKKVKVLWPYLHLANLLRPLDRNCSAPGLSFCLDALFVAETWIWAHFSLLFKNWQLLN